MLYFCLFCKKNQNHAVNFCAFGQKTQMFGKFWEIFENFWWKFNGKIEFFSIFWENLLLKIETSEITSFFYNNFFPVRGGGFNPPPSNTPSCVLHWSKLNIPESRINFPIENLLQTLELGAFIAGWYAEPSLCCKPEEFFAILFKYSKHFCYHCLLLKDSIDKLKRPPDDFLRANGEIIRANETHQDRVNMATQARCKSQRLSSYALIYKSNFPTSNFAPIIPDSY